MASILAATLSGCSGSGNSAPALPTNAALKGAYVLSSTGTDPNDGLYDVAASLTFDGAGNVTSGIADYNLGSGIDTDVPLTGTYTVAGTNALVTLSDGQGTQDTFAVALPSTAPATGYVVSLFDGTGTGTLSAQSAGSSFSTTGTYTYSLSGMGQGTLVSTGGFTVAAGTITAGTQSITDGSDVTSYPKITGILEPVQSNGRGQAAFNGYTFGYYPVTANSIVLVGLDDRSLLYGTAQKM